MDHKRMQAAIKDPQLTERMYAFVNGYEVAPLQVVIPPVVELATFIPLHLSIPLATHKARSMSELFRNRGKVIFYYRDGDLDGWFTANSPQCPAGTASLVKTPRAMTFRQMAQSATGLQSESLADLSRAIVTKGLDIVPTQWDDAIGATQNGTDLLLVNGYANFAFTKTDKKLKDENQQVVVLCARRDDDGRWGAGVCGLDNDDEWNADYRLLLRNSP